MVAIEKGIDTLATEWGRRMVNYTSNELYEPVMKTTRVLETRIKELGRSDTQTEKRAQVTIPTTLWSLSQDIKHTTVKREQVDIGVVDEIRLYVKQYEEGIKEAVSNMRMTAEAQTYRPQTFYAMLKAMSEDSKEHTAYLKELFKDGREEFDNAKTYKELLGSAAMLRGELKVISTGISKHLEGIAREEKTKSELRK